MSNSIPSVETKVENRTNVEVSSVCPNNAKPLVVCSQSKAFPEKTFCNSEKHFSTEMSLYDNYIKRRNDFDKRFGLTVKKGGLSKESYNLSRHYWALGVFD
jgi:hypothetical protein